MSVAEECHNRYNKPVSMQCYDRPKTMRSQIDRLATLKSMGVHNPFWSDSYDP